MFAPRERVQHLHACKQRLFLFSCNRPKETAVAQEQQSSPATERKLPCAPTHDTKLIVMMTHGAWRMAQPAAAAWRPGGQRKALSGTRARARRPGETHRISRWLGQKGGRGRLSDGDVSHGSFFFPLSEIFLLQLLRLYHYALFLCTCVCPARSFCSCVSR